MRRSVDSIFQDYLTDKVPVPAASPRVNMLAVSWNMLPFNFCFLFHQYNHFLLFLFIYVLFITFYFQALLIFFFVWKGSLSLYHACWVCHYRFCLQTNKSSSRRFWTTDNPRIKSKATNMELISWYEFTFIFALGCLLRNISITLRNL